MTNKKRFIYLIISSVVVFCLSPLILSSQSTSGEKLNVLLVKYKNAETDSLKIEHLFSIAHYYNDFEGNAKKADSISEIALSIAASSYRPEMLILAYNLYIESNDIVKYYTKSIDYAKKAEQYGKNINNPLIEFRNYKCFARVYNAGYKYDHALEYAFRALSVADGLDDKLLKAESYLLIGKSMEGKNQEVEAFRNYLNALGISETMEDKMLLGKCYAQLSGFYQNNKVYDKATYYKLKQGDLLKTEPQFDSLAMMWMVYDLQVIAMHAETKLTTAFFTNILNYAIKHQVHRLKKYEMALYRTFLIKNEEYKQLYNFYNKDYPKEYSRLKNENAALYFTLQAYFHETDDLIDSAFYFFSRAEQEILSSPNKILQANFFNRYGQFLIRQNKTDIAVLKFLKAYDLAKETNYSQYMIDAVEQLESLYVGLNQYEGAYKFALLKRDLQENLQELSKKDQMVLMEINHEDEQRTIIEEIELKKIERRHNIQYTGMLIGIFAVFILLIMFGSFKVPKWVIQMIGFFSFIFLFEFIILLADFRIHHLTHGEPWKILLIKIFLIAFLLPLHHWIEKKVVDYLLSNRLINFSSFSPLKFLKEITGIGNNQDNSH